ncbi:MAG TPA: 5-(carboxyamino)imidazole ribonucleotide mutase [Ignavibacteria bacterium]|mgnify:CR=1 FL=1|nr:5-(carboxyamino)imidazole ribonucleotide mutase [Ignavibacteria bacterium]HMR41196.1 5-(carboxyamino)imidazole ribonucleotide mutase [Ignavibacteria bacterium]
MPDKKSKPVVGVIMGSDSDMPVMKQAIDILEDFNIPFEVKITSAHRTPDLMSSYSRTAYKRGIKVIIAGAGGSAHLPGMCAAYATIPVIGVPVESKTLKGLDSLLSIVQMPFGVPVATVAINNAKNAALLAIKILAVSDKNIMKKIVAFKKKTEKESLDKNKLINF